MVKCPTCGDQYKELGTHWRYNENHRIAFTEKQEEIIKGLMLGDGSLGKPSPNANPTLSCNCVEKEYLEWLDETFGVLGVGVTVHQTAEKAVENAKQTGFDEDASVESYSTSYHWNTRAHNALEKYMSWYNDGTVTFPVDLELTRTALKHWYCSDGNIKKMDGHEVFELSTTAPVEGADRPDYIKQLFNKFGVDAKINKNGKNVYFTKSDSKTLWRIIGKPIPGFEYKFPMSGD